MLDRVELISIPENKSDNFRTRITRFLQRNDLAKVVVASGWFVAVLSCVIFISLHQNTQIVRLRNQLHSRELDWKVQSTQLENRVKREADKLAQWKEEQVHSIAKRSSERVEGEIAEESRGPPVGGAVYTRWGRHDCPELGPSYLIYHGITAGSSYGHSGGGRYICLHANVTYDDHYVSGFNGASQLYGVEWRDSTWINNLYDLRDVMDRNVQYHSVPCALCLAEKRYGQVMIPGKSECPEHWIMEYEGYIMAAGHSDKHSTEFICVDRRPQVIAGTQGSQGGGSIMMVETHCTSLHCEPVVAGREIRCVVCTI